MSRIILTVLAAVPGWYVLGATEKTSIGRHGIHFRCARIGILCDPMAQSFL